MSEEKKTANMLAAADMTSKFYDVLPAQLEDWMSKGDANECLELIKFIRRYVPDVPVTDYRTVGFPTSIKAFLDACGLENGKDYNIEASSLDASSHVVSFRRTNATGLLLGHIAGLRVKSGPSVCDKLYCEMGKEMGRDFKKAMVSGEIATRQDFREYVLERTELVYRYLAKELKERKEDMEKGTYKRLPYLSEEDDKLDMEVLEFAATQISGDKLLPTATPVVPVAVAELFCALFGDTLKFPRPADRIFRLGKNPSEWVAARPLVMSAHSSPCFQTAESPVQLLRKINKKFDQYMPTDAYTFNGAEGSSADSAYVLSSSPIRFPAANAEDTVRTFNVIENRRSLMGRVNTYYRSCYPDLGVAIYSSSGMAFPVGSKYQKEFAHNESLSYKLTQEADNLLGLSPTPDNPGLVMTSAFVLSPFTSNFGPSQFEGPRSVALNICRQKKENKKKSAKSHDEVSIASSWFRLVHNVAAPTFSEAEAPEKMEKFLTEAISQTEAGAIPTALAIGLRTTIAKMQEKTSNMRIRGLSLNVYRKNADPNGLHSNDKFITQLVSTVAGTTNRSFAAFIKDAEAGKQVTSPSYPSVAYMFPGTAPSNVAKFLDIADKTLMQVRDPRKVADFAIYAETNISYHALAELYESLSGFTATLQNHTGAELRGVLFKKIITEGLNKLAVFDKIQKSLGKNSAIVRMAQAINSGTCDNHWFDVCLEQDTDGRAILAVRVCREAAFLAMLLHADESEFDSLLTAAVQNDPASVFLSDENWKEELLDHLILNAPNALFSTHPGLRNLTVATSIYSGSLDSFDDGDFIVPDVSTYGLFNRNLLTTKFQHLAAGNPNGANVDPN